MHDAIIPLSGTMEHKKLHGLLLELSQFGLIATLPHAHNEKGDIIPLENSRVIYEEGLHVSFPLRDEISPKAVAVGWGVLDGEIMPIAFCCQGPEPEPWSSIDK